MNPFKCLFRLGRKIKKKLLLMLLIIYLIRYVRDFFETNQQPKAIDESLKDVPIEGENLFEKHGYHTDETLVDLSNSNIDVILFGSLEKYPNLIDLKLSSNKFETIKMETFSGGYQLEKLDLSYNLIYYLEIGWCRDLGSLVHLNLDNNKITELKEPIFECLPRLRFLYLSDNGLFHLEPNVFTGLGSLSVLDLSDNDLTSLTRDLLAPFASSIEDLKASRNNFTNLDQNLLQGMDKLKQFHLLGIKSIDFKFNLKKLSVVVNPTNAYSDEIDT